MGEKKKVSVWRNRLRDDTEITKAEIDSYGKYVARLTPEGRAFLFNSSFGIFRKRLRSLKRYIWAKSKRLKEMSGGGRWWPTLSAA